MTKELRTRLEKIISRRQEGVNTKYRLVRVNDLNELIAQHDKQNAKVNELMNKVECARASLK